MQDNPLAYFITWTIYGTFLQGDPRWWNSRTDGSQSPQPKLEQWHRKRLNHDIVLLGNRQREQVANEIQRLCDYRMWKLWAVSPRTNHIHVVVSANEVDGKIVRNQLKANCTRVLRENEPLLAGRPVWSTGGDWKCINSDDGLENAIIYVAEAQERMNREK